MYRLGTHISLSSLLKSDFPSNCNYIQVFTKSPRSISAVSKLDNNVLNSIKQVLGNLDIEIVIHAPYTLNFCKSKECQRLSLIEDLKIVSKMTNLGSGSGVVVHLGKNVEKKSKEEAIRIFVSEISRVVNETKDSNSKILIETSCGQGTEICFDLKDLGFLYNSFEENVKERIGFCIDTAHIFAAGYNISSESGIKNFISEFDKLIGLSKWNLLHLNDSKKKLNSRVDRHEEVGKGEIYKETKEGLSFLISKVEELGVPVILEEGPEAIDLVKSFYTPI